MTIEQRERMRRKKRRQKQMRRTMRSVLLFPSRLPRASEQAVLTAVKACEVIGLAFVVVLICSMLNPSSLLVVLRTVSALAFFFLFFFYKT